MSDPVVQGSHGSSRDQGYYPLGVQIYYARAGEGMRFGAVGGVKESHATSSNQGGTLRGSAKARYYARAGTETLGISIASTAEPLSLRYRERHPERERERRRKQRHQLRALGRAEIAAFRASGCVDCGRPATLCHHVDPASKEFGIREWKRSPRAYGLRRLRLELAKCVPMCGYCHSRLHAGWRLEAKEALS